MHFILVSSCLLGEAVRYDGGDKRNDSSVLRQWLREGRVVGVCPEVAGGLSVPRLPAEIAGANGGAGVLAGAARVIDRAGRDVSACFVSGAEHALALARARGIRIAVLKEGSPSCGSSAVHDGSFTSAMLPGAGVTTALLRDAGVHVFSETQFEQAAELLHALESDASA